MHGMYNMAVINKNDSNILILFVKEDLQYLSNLTLFLLTIVSVVVSKVMKIKLDIESDKVPI